MAKSVGSGGRTDRKKGLRSRTADPLQVERDGAGRGGAAILPSARLVLKFLIYQTDSVFGMQYFQVLIAEL